MFFTLQKITMVTKYNLFTVNTWILQLKKSIMSKKLHFEQNMDYFDNYA